MVSKWCRDHNTRGEHVSIIVNPMLTITSAFQIPDSEFEFTFARSSGPGGQNVNKVNSKAVLRWSPTVSPSLSEDVRARFLARFASRLTTAGELNLTSQRSRDQSRNSAECLGP